MTTMIDVEPQPRIDALVRLPGGGEVRRTECTGTAWFDGKPVVSGLALQRSPTAPRGIRVPNFSASFFIPDSVPYLRDALGDATLTTSVVLQASGQIAAIVGSAATFTDDPSGAPAWIQVHVHGHLGWAAGIGYRIVALTSPDAVRLGHKRPRRLVDRI